MTTYIMQAVSSSDGKLYGWQAATADFAASGYTGPGSPQHVAIAGQIQGGSGLNIAKFTNNDSPIAVWNFNGNLNDSSGNGQTLAVSVGAESYSDAFPGFRGFYANASSTLIAPNSAAFRILGDITLFAMVQSNTQGQTGGIISQTGPSSNSEATADNYLYEITMPFGGGNAPSWFHETTAAANQLYTPSGVRTPFIHNLTWICATRTSNVVQFWVNGRKLGAASSALSAAFDGANSRLYISGNPDGGILDALIAGVKICPSALADANVLAEWNATMGSFFNLV